MSIFYFRDIEKAHPDIQLELANLVESGVLQIQENNQIQDLNLKNSSFIFSSSQEISYISERLLDFIDPVELVPLGPAEQRKVLELQVEKILKSLSQNKEQLHINSHELKSYVDAIVSKNAHEGNGHKSWNEITREIRNAIAQARLAAPVKTDSTQKIYWDMQWQNNKMQAVYSFSPRCEELF